MVARLHYSTCRNKSAKVAMGRGMMANSGVLVWHVEVRNGGTFSLL